MESTYASQLARVLILKTDELAWLYMEAEARLSLSQEWSEEACEANDPEWDTRFIQDIEVLQAALEHVQEGLKRVGIVVPERKK